MDYSHSLPTGDHLGGAAVAPAGALDFDRSVKFSISNSTRMGLTLVDSYMECGQINDAPGAVEPKETKNGFVTAKIGARGVKGALIYEWGDKIGRICMYLENTVIERKNNCGIQYHWWKPWESSYWYYSHVPATPSGCNQVTARSKGFTLTSSIGEGNNAEASFVLET